MIKGQPIISYPGHFVPKSFIPFWSFRTQFFHFVPRNNHFVPSLFRTHFGHFVPSSTGYDFVPSSTGYEMTFRVISYLSHFVPIWSFRTYVISYLGYFVKKFGHFVSSLVISYLVQLGTVPILMILKLRRWLFHFLLNGQTEGARNGRTEEWMDECFC